MYGLSMIHREILGLAGVRQAKKDRGKSGTACRQNGHELTYLLLFQRFLRPYGENCNL